MVRRTWTRCTIATVILGASLAVAATSAGAKTRWTITPTASPGAIDSAFVDVSCPTTTFCVGVGYSESSDTGSLTLAEQRDGVEWSLMTTPNPAASSDFLGVSCASATNCVAVGLSGSPGQALVESWDGAAWTVVPGPNPGSGQSRLNAVACVSASECVAVGSANNGATALIERWDGANWTISANPKPFAATRLVSVSCWAHNRCVFAAGPVGEGHLGDPLIARYNGRTWSAMAGGTAQLFSVSCTSATWCVGVGYAYFNGNPGVLIDTWNGVAWTAERGPSPGSDINLLSGVSCVSTTRCTAVGTWGNTHKAGSAYKTLIESWDGVAWTVVTSPNPDGLKNATLDAVSCSDKHTCAAVGAVGNIPGGQTLALLTP